MEKHHYYVLLSVVFGLLLLTELGRQELAHTIQYDQLRQDVIVIPVTAHLISEPSGRFSTMRDEQNIIDIIQRANLIWAQANISFSVERIVTDTVSANTVPRVLNRETPLFLQSKLFDERVINAYFVRFIGANGIAFTNNGFFMIADRTSVNDYRTVAHELGHLLGLRHVPDRNRLMYSGSNGELLTEEGINAAREHAWQLAMQP